MNLINKLLRQLPIVIYNGYVFLLLSILFCLEWFYKYNTQIEYIDYMLCTIMVVHFILDFKNYSTFAKSSFFTIMALAIYHLIYYAVCIDNFYYYTIYIIILLSNLAYNVLAEMLRPQK
jgi:hypothetical protein